MQTGATPTPSFLALSGHVQRFGGGPAMSLDGQGIRSLPFY
jgi:hypothetical protein